MFSQYRHKSCCNIIFCNVHYARVVMNVCLAQTQHENECDANSDVHLEICGLIDSGGTSKH